MFADFIKNSENYPSPASLQNGPLRDDETAIIFWSSGTTGIPKGIQHSVKYMKRYLYLFELMKSRGPRKIPKITTTCFFHVGGFISPFDLWSTVIFNSGSDLDGEHCTELLYKEINCFKPQSMVCGSHHLVQMSQNPPINDSLDLSSVLTVMPMGTRVPDQLYEDLKKKLKSLTHVNNYYSMSEICGVITSSKDVKCLGAVYPGAIVKIVDPDNGKLCGYNEVHTLLPDCIVRHILYKLAHFVKTTL